MRKTVPLFLAPAVASVLLAGCSSTNVTTSHGNPAAGTAPVSISMTDDPPSGVQVLFFQVSLTAATLTPQSGSPVSLLSGNTPVQIDVTQLQALSAFLSTADIAAGTYTGLNLTFASPQLVIFNQSDSSLGSDCAVGSVCLLTPAFENSTDSLSFTTTPFPVTVSATSPLGFLVDFHLNTVIQSDLSVNLAAANGVTIASLPSAPTPPQFGSVTGTVGTVDASNNSFSLQTEWGRSFTVDTTNTTTFSSFPASACSTAGFGCVAQGQVVKVQVSSVAGGGVLTASQVTYVQEASAQTVEGTIIRIPPLPLPAGETVIQLILHRNPNGDTSLPLGGMATVAVWAPASGSNPATTFSIDNSGFTIPSGLTFASANDLTVGQTVQVTVTPGSLTSNGGGPGNNGWGRPHSVSFTASSVELEPSQITGWVTGVDSGTSSFTLGVGLGPIFGAWPMGGKNALSFNVVTASGTTYTGLNPDSFSGLADNEFVSVNGWFFAPTTSNGPPNIVAQSVKQRANNWF